ncbi:MAG: hypothetical protein HOD99_11875 [Planctomycetaceae bacterium]|nr:hypothetical protein [Planctomycetaceae bacterium]
MENFVNGNYAPSQDEWSFIDIAAGAVYKQQESAAFMRALLERSLAGTCGAKNPVGMEPLVLLSVPVIAWDRVVFEKREFSHISVTDVVQGK